MPELADEQTARSLSGLGVAILQVFTAKTSSQSSGSESLRVACASQVWKTRMGRFRNETTVEAFKQVWAKGGVKCATRRRTTAASSALLV